MSANNEEDWSGSRRAVLGGALAYYMVGTFGIKDDLAVSDAFAWYWLPNSLFLAALLLSSATSRLQLLVVSIAHVVPLSSKLGADAIIGTLICNEGFVLCAVAVLRPLLDEQARSPCRLSLDTTHVKHSVGSALLLVGAAWLLVSLGDVTSISPAARSLIERCFAASSLSD